MVNPSSIVDIVADSLIAVWKYLRKAKITVGILLAGAFFLLSTTVGHAEISGSKHDFSTEDWSGNRICEPCHTPHNATAADAPLWNHSISVATYTLYDSQWLGGGYPYALPPVQPEAGSITRLCLSCHDGTVSMDAFGGLPGSTKMEGRAVIGTNLMDDHPVSIEWQHVPATFDICTNCHWDMPLPFYGPEGSKRLECPTCHEPHNGEPYAHMLRKPNADSEICLVCHDK
jgi:predicted CXXCH cytochrome family protein